MRNMRRLVSMLLSMAMCLSFATPAFAAGRVDSDGQETGSVYVCGLEEHTHSSACYVGDPIGDLLASNGLSGYTGEVKIVHQHSGACYSGGVLVCPLADPGVLAAHPNVSVVHRHDGNCAGCTLPETDYVIFGGEGGASSSSGTGPSEDFYVVGTPGGDKDTGETMDGGSSVEPIAEHVHGPDCGDDCPLDVVIRYVAESGASGTPICGEQEHVHGPGCLGQAAQAAPSVKPAGISAAISRLPAKAVVRGARLDLSDDREIRVRVEYPSVVRDTAQVTYTIPGRGTGVHVIACIDTSIDNRESMEDLSQAMLAAETVRYGYCYDGNSGGVAYDTGATARTIVYESQASDITGDFDNSTGYGGADRLANDLNHDFKRPGIGQADEAAALDAILASLDSVPSGRVPVVFWALSPDDAIAASASKDMDAIKAKLEAVREKLVSMGGELVTWQRGDKSSSWLAGDSTYVNCAPSASFRQAVTDSLVAIVSDRVDGCVLSLSIPSGVDLATGIRRTGVSVGRVTNRGVDSLPEGYTYSVSGRNLSISIPRFYNSVNDTEISFTVNLDTGKNVRQLVPDGFSVSGSYQLGARDEAVRTYPAFPGFDLDRKLRTISFKAEAGSGADKTKTYSGLPGESVLAPDGSAWSTGDEFSGWANASRPDAVLRAGEEARFSEEDTVMTALWGHVALGLYLGSVTQGPEPGNQMYPGALESTKKESWSSTLTKLRSAFKNQIGVDLQKDITSVQVMNERIVPSGKPFDILTVKNGINGGKPNGVYIGVDGANPVVMYVTGSSGSYKLYLSGIGGVTASYSMNGMFSAYISGDLRNQSTKLTSVDFSLLNTRYVTSMASLFYCCRNLTSIKFGSIDTANVTNMAKMFGYCSSIGSIPLSNFNTRSVTDMSEMFHYCESLTSIDVSKFNTSNVTTMSRMFTDCHKLAALSVRNFNTSKVLNMSGMFSGMFALTSVDVSSFDTSHVVDMSDMFGRSSKITALDVSAFDTSSVTNMRGMFSYLYVLPSLDLRSFDTSRVTSMYGMFQNSYKLSSLDLSNFDTANVMDMGAMFYECHALRSIKLGNKFVTAKVINMSGMFGDCEVLSSIDVSRFNTALVTSTAYMFANCAALSTLDLSSFNTAKVTDMNWMFAGCTKLSRLVLGSNFDTGKVTAMDKMFDSCSSLSSLDLGGKFNTSNVSDFRCMFHGCTGLSSIKFGSQFYISGAMYGEAVRTYFYYQHEPLNDYTYGMFENCYNLASVSGLKWKDAAIISTSLMTNMFKNCQKLTSVSLPVARANQNFSSLSSVSGMFQGCTALTSVDLSGWVVPNLSHMDNMFNGAGSGKTLTIKMTWDGFTNTTLSANGVANASRVNLYIGKYAKDGTSVYTQKKNIITAFKSVLGTSKLTVYDDTGATIPLTSLSIVAPGMMLLSVERQGSSLPSNDKIDYTQKIPTYADATPVGTKVPYIIRVEYEGDDHGKSGIIDVRYPLPKGVVPDTSISAASRVQVGMLELAGGQGLSSKGNLVAGKGFQVTGSAASGYILSGSLKDIPAGAHIDVTVKCVLDAIDDSTRENVGGQDRWTWTGAAYSSSNSGAASSNPLRLWFSYATAVVKPDQSYASVSFRYVGDVPVGVVVPESKTYKSGNTVAMAQPAAVSGYTFDGWYRDNAGSRRTSYSITSSDVSSGKEIVFYGRWSVSGTGVNKLTYQYDGSAPAGVGAGQSTELKPGAVCDIMRPSDVYGYAFAGWKDVLVDGKSNTALPKSGTLDTSSLGYGKEITYVGAWTPHMATIRFVSADTGEEVAEPMRVQVADTRGELPASDAAPMGWSLGTTILDERYEAGTPASLFTGQGNLLSEDGDELVLYAVSGSASPLPKTGGIGDTPFLAVGIGMLVLASGIYAKSRKRED